jgi:alkanesulfonate monooxygenase SsuD/methylene tetrahydromethanopterin reductase-like flavin-dependent oxidoreductase (luciferase family)
MKFGIFYEHQIPRPWNEGDEHRLFKEALDQVELADRLGIDYVWEVEHHFLEEYSHSSAPEVFLAACSQRTTQIRLGHGIVLMPPGYNHPARVAERIATLDLVSDGRVDWGTGESSSRIELEGFGVDPQEKRDMWMEAVRETARMMAADPYSGYDGAHFSMPHRNVVPKPLQRPHPPIWVACSNRETIKLAAQLGIGALTFAFVDAEEARHWVSEYYDTFKSECRPIGLDVNPNIAMVTGFMCHEDSDTAVERGLEGFQFFGYALSHFYATGTHVPGKFDIWEDFLANGPKERGPTGCIGDPDRVRDTLRIYEEAGVDQVVFIQQGGRNRHEHICESLRLFSHEVLPEFRGRDIDRQKAKLENLAPYVQSARQRIHDISVMDDVPPVESYPVLMERLGGPQEPQSQNGSTILERLGAQPGDD